MNTSDHDNLLSLLRRIAFERRAVVLASGRESNFYIDCRRVSLHPEGLVLCGRALFGAYQRMERVVQAVGGPTLGADPLICSFAIAAAGAGASMPAFIIRKQAKGHGTGSLVEGLSNIQPGAPVLVLEDVVTTGGSTRRAIEACRQEGLNPIQVLALVDRCEGGADAIEASGVPFASLFTRHDFMGEE